MHAVVARVKIGDVEKAQQGLRDEVIPRVSQAPGFVAGYWTRSEGGDDGLSMLLRTPVVDETGLTGRYTFEAKLPPESSAAGQAPDSSAIIGSLKDNGLTVVSVTVTEKHVIVETDDRIPTQN